MSIRQKCLSSLNPQVLFRSPLKFLLIALIIVIQAGMTKNTFVFD